MRACAVTASHTYSLAYMIHDAARQFRRAFEVEARHHKLTLPQWRVIGRLARTDGLSQTVLAGLVDTNPMTLSDIADRLERNGLIRREPDPSDSRAKLVWITDKARALVDEMHLVAESVYDVALDGVSQADEAALMRTLSKITANLANERRVEKEPAE